MLNIKNKRHKPLYKKFISLRANVQYRKRLHLLKFKKKKWQRLIFSLQRMLNRRKKNFKTYDINKYYLPKFYNPFKRKYKSILLGKGKFSLFYGGLSVKFIKKQVNLVVNNKKRMIKNRVKLNQVFLSLMEKRLDIILYRAHFINSVRNARQLILHRHIQVNNRIITNPSYILKEGDIITINTKIQPFIYKNITQAHLWPLPPKYLQINYKTFEIIFTDNIEFQNISNLYPFWPEIFSLTRYYR